MYTHRMCASIQKQQDDVQQNGTEHIIQGSRDMFSSFSQIFSDPDIYFKALF